MKIMEHEADDFGDLADLLRPESTFARSCASAEIEADASDYLASRFEPVEYTPPELAAMKRAYESICAEAAKGEDLFMGVAEVPAAAPTVMALADSLEGQGA